MIKVYILYSRSLKKYYVGQTHDIVDRLKRHNEARSKFTRHGIPWEVVWEHSCKSRSEAIILERRIKKRGAKRFLANTHGV